MGKLFIVATPIGNLEDISLRALRILRDACLIAAEDTRRTRKLLTHYDIHTPLTSYYEHNKIQKLKIIIDSLSDGDVALVSDSGTPLINDPGYELVTAVLDAGYQVSPIPGPSAPIAALTVSGITAESFLYYGYLPRKKVARRKLITEIAQTPFTLIFLETPHRLLASLQDFNDIAGDRLIAVARELTKLNEEIFRGSISDAVQYFSENLPRGEFTIVMDGWKETEEKWAKDLLDDEIEHLMDDGESASQIASKLSGPSGWPRRDIYRIIVNRAGN